MAALLGMPDTAQSFSRHWEIQGAVQASPPSEIDHSGFFYYFILKTTPQNVIYSSYIFERKILFIPCK